MTLLQPVMLWFGLLLIPLAAIYLLKIRPQRKITTTWFLWESVLQQKKSSALFRRLRDLLSLLLMIIAILACVLAMSSPVPSAPDRNKDLIILIDNSVSMSAIDNGKTRLEQAVNTATDIVKAMSLDRQAIIAAVAGEIRFTVNMTANQRELIKGINSIEPSHMPFHAKVLDELQADKKFMSRARTLLITDGCFEGSETIQKIEIFKVGKPVDNIGLTGFDLARLPGKKDRLGLFFRCSSSFESSRPIDVFLCKDNPDNIIRVYPLIVQPGTNPPEIYTIDNVAAGKWILRIEIDDALALDNEAYAIVPPHRPISVGVQAGKEALFLAKCVESFRRDAVGLRLDQKNPEIILSCGTPAQKNDSRLQIIFHPSGKSPFWTSTGSKLESPIAQVKLRDHPVLRFNNMEDVSFLGAVDITTPENALVLVESMDGTPLIYRVNTDTNTAYVINMDPIESDFFLSAYFPVTVYSMARDLTGRTMDNHVRYSPGTYVPFENEPAGTQFIITSPDGSITQKQAPFKLSLDQLGFHAVKGGNSTNLLACSLPGRAESLLDNSKIPDTHDPIERGWPLSMFFTVAALLTVAVESMLYHRRKVG
ncbi:VWA domain-containing protein [Verrucomicrobiota bacterium]